MSTDTKKPDHDQQTLDRCTTALVKVMSWHLLFLLFSKAWSWFISAVHHPRCDTPVYHEHPAPDFLLLSWLKFCFMLLIWTTSVWRTEEWGQLKSLLWYNMWALSGQAVKCVSRSETWHARLQNTICVWGRLQLVHCAMPGTHPCLLHTKCKHDDVCVAYYTLLLPSLVRLTWCSIQDACMWGSTSYFSCDGMRRPTNLNCQLHTMSCSGDALARRLSVLLVHSAVWKTAGQE